MLRLAASIIVVLSCACDGSRSRGRDELTPADGGSTLGDAAARTDGGPASEGDGGAAPSDGSVASTDGGGAICGPVGSWECGPRECHDNPSCVARDLARAGRESYTECGTASFTEADSLAACETGPPFGDWPIEFRCGQASFSGTLRFFCAPDGSEVVVRYQVHGRMPMTTGTDFYTTWGTDFWQGSGGGSGEGYLHLDETDLTTQSIYFVGYHETPIPESGTSALTVWFIVESYFPSAMSERFIGGGFQVAIDSSGPAG